MPKVRRDTKRALLDAAAAEFAKFGLEGARMHAIVKRAGINERMIYHHFGSKVGLYEAVLADHWLASAGAALTNPPRDVDVREAFAAMLEQVVRGVLAPPHFLSLALHEALTGWKHVPRASLGDIPAPLRELFERGQRTGVFRRDRRFEVVYLTALGAALASQLLASRFVDLRSRNAHERLLADVMSLVLEGVTP